MKLTSLRLRRAIAALDAPSPDNLAQALSETLIAECLHGLGRAETQHVASRVQTALERISSKNDDNSMVYELLQGAAAALGSAVIAHAFVSHPAPIDLVAWRTGRLETWQALEVGLHIRRCPSCKDAVLLLARMQQAQAAQSAAPQADVWLRAAAKSQAAVRAPEGGVVLWSDETLGAELLRFDDGPVVRLALYAESVATVRLESAALVTEEMQPGYWLGSLAEGVERLTARVIVGDRTQDVTLDVPHID